MLSALWWFINIVIRYIMQLQTVLKANQHNKNSNKLLLIKFTAKNVYNH